MKKFSFLALLALTAALLIACGDKTTEPPLDIPAPTSAPTLAPAQTLSECPDPTPSTQLLRSDKHGYCALYPTGYDVIEPNPDETVLAVGSLMNVENPRAYLEARDAGGQTAAQAVDELIAQAQVVRPDYTALRSTIEVGGEQAIVLDNLPGQDINRRLLVVHGGRIYDLTFAPLGEAPAAAKTEELYKTIVDSWRFLANP